MLLRRLKSNVIDCASILLELFSHFSPLSYVRK